MALTFPKTVRLTRGSDYARVKGEGRSFGGRFMVLGFLKVSGESKVGMITSRRVGDAVVRNRVRRQLREILRQARPQWAAGYRIVVIARYTAAKASYHELEAEWKRLANRARFLTTPPAGQPE